MSEQVTQVSKQKKTPESIQQAASKVTEEIQRAGGMSESAENTENIVEKKQITFKGIIPSSIKLDENIRKNINTESEEFKRLIESIDLHGILQSILVEERVNESGESYYVCVEGHRRVLASIKLDLKAVPCMVKRYNNSSTRIEEALAADIKQFLNPLDRAEAYLSILNNGKEIKEIAKIYEKDPLTVQRYIKIARWPKEAKELIYAHPELFNAKFLLHNYVQKGIEGDELIQAIKNRIEANTKSSSKDEKTKDLNELEISHNSTLITNALKKYNAKVNLKQKDKEVIATFKFSPENLKEFIENLQRL